MKYKTYYTKEYFEEFARLVLNEILNLSLIHRAERYGTDRPDLISDDEEIGVEVTSAKSENEGRHIKLFQQQYPRENRTEIIKQEARRLKIEKDLFVVDGLVSVKINDSRTDRIKILADTINTKLKKLNEKDYNKYPTNALYIDAFHYVKEDIEDLLNDYDKHIKPHFLNFDYIYILHMDGLYIIENKNYNILQVDENIVPKFKPKALEYAKEKNNMT